MFDALINHVSAADYQLLAPIPQLVKSGATTDFQTYIPALVKLVIGLAGGAAVLMIIFGGIQYMSTDAFSGKSSAKETIQNALIGLLLAMSAWIILYTVNPKLVDIGISLQGVGSTNPLGTDLGGGTACTQANKCTSGVAFTCASGANGCNTVTTKACTETDPCTTGVKACQNCRAVEDDNTYFRNKKSTDSPAGCSLGPCQVHQEMFNQLSFMHNTTSAGTNPLAWRVTEMFPPTVEHLDNCHDNGTCVDIALLGNIAGLSNADYAAKIKLLFTAIESAKSISGVSAARYEYEICPASRLTSFLQSIQNDEYLKDKGSKFKCETTTTADNLHLEITP